MERNSFPSSLRGVHAHFVGAKGTGMAALAEIFAARGALLTGSDVADVFYTDAILAAIGVVPFAGFEAGHVAPETEIVIFSPAYNPDSNPELLEAKRRGLPTFSYPEALGELSRHGDSSGVAGVHGKTTTTAMAGTLLEALECPATILAGSAVGSFGGRCTYIGGDRYFVAETCEYRRHFLNFSPRRILLTSVESDHQDFYPTYESIRDAFREYCDSLPPGGKLIYCADDRGASEVAEWLRVRRPDVLAESYGFAAKGPWKLSAEDNEEGVSLFRLAGSPLELSLHVPGKHLVLDAAGAIALAYSIMYDYSDKTPLNAGQWARVRDALASFRGSKRRSEIVGEADGVLVMDDYAHHPTAIRATIEGIKAFWPSRRLVVDFMSHTYSRTHALLDEFAASLDRADSVILHKIYPSAREKPIEGVSGRLLFEKMKERRADLADLADLADPGKTGKTAEGLGFALYSEEPEDAAETLVRLLRPGDIFITMGAGDNWKLGRKIFELLKSKGK